MESKSKKVPENIHQDRKNKIVRHNNDEEFKNNNTILSENNEYKPKNKGARLL